jgi:hypothetical protein
VHIDIIEETGDESPAVAFPPDDDTSDLRENPQQIEPMPAARRHASLRSFLTSVNGPESILATGNIAIKADLPSTVSSGAAQEFASQIEIVFAVPSLNWERRHYADLCSGLKDLLERDTSDALRVALRISRCDFRAEKRNGFCLAVRLVAEGNSEQQAELRWGLGLARLQQALLFSSRALKQQVGE